MITRKAIMRAIACTLASGSVVLHAAESITVNIPSGDLAAALESFAKQTGLDLVFRSDQLKGARTDGIAGTLTPQDAVQKLLEGTAFVVKKDAVTGAMVVTPLRTSSPASEGGGGDELRLAHADGESTEVSGDENPGISESDLTEVTVFGRGVRQSVRDIPQTVNTIDQELLLDNTAEVGLVNVLRFMPSTSLLLGEYGLGVYVSMRGFGASTIWNGMPYRSTNQVPSLSNVERVEALMGPASVLYGSMEPGGVINIVTKQPKNGFHFASGLQVGSYDMRGGSVDVGGPISDRVRVRLNASYDETGAEFDHYRRELVSIAPVVAIDLGPDTVLTLEGQYQKSLWPLGYWENSRPVAGTLFPNSDLGPLPENVNYGRMEGFSRSFYDSTDVSARFSHKLGESTSMNASDNHHVEDSHEKSVFAGFDIGADGRSIDRYPWIAQGRNREHSFHADIRHELTTGAIRHELMLGTDIFSGDRGSDELCCFEPPPIDAYEPDYSFVPTGDLSPYSWDLDSDIKEVAIQDRLRFADRWAVLLGLRYTDFKSDFADFVDGGTEPSSTAEFSGSETSSQLGVVYTLSDRVALFANRSEAFVPRNELDINNRPLAPEQSRQLEFGAKFDVGSGGLSGNLALFRIEKPNVIAIAPNDPSARVPIGSVEVQGVELSVQGKLTPHWSAFAGYAYLDSEMKDASDFNAKGAEFGNTPRHSFSLINNYEVQGGALRGLGLNLAYQFMGKRWADTGIPDDPSTPDVDETVPNVLRLPSYHRVDLSASYPLTPRLRASVHGNNLLDEDIYSNSFSSLYTYVGIGRTYSARVRYEF